MLKEPFRCLINFFSVLSKEFLKSEYEKMKNGEQTPWCEDGYCYDCGACK